MSTQHSFDPDLEAEKGLGLTGEALSHHWALVRWRVVIEKAPLSASLVSAAYLALEYWGSLQRTAPCKHEGFGISAAFEVVCELMRRQPDVANDHASSIAGYFQSQSIFVAFTAVRQFELHIPEHRYRVLGQLVDLAAARDLPPSPVGMTLGGIAFLQLFLHDPAYATWPQLQRARDECIYGCFHWTYNGQNVGGARFAELGEEIASFGVSDA